MADSLRPGGIYILGFHLLPPDASEECIERWTERQGKTQVTVTLRVLATDRRRRIETLRISLLARTSHHGGADIHRSGAVIHHSGADIPVCREERRELRLRDEFQFRMYTAAQFRRLLSGVPQLELCDVYDFWYEIDHPMKLDNEMSDTVFVLRKRP